MAKLPTCSHYDKKGVIFNPPLTGISAIIVNQKQMLNSRFLQHNNVVQYFS
jgi:hypothetical protein